MTSTEATLKPLKDAFISSVFTLAKASNDSAGALVNLLEKMEQIGALSPEDLGQLARVEQLSHLANSAKAAPAPNSQQAPSTPQPAKGTRTYKPRQPKSVAETPAQPPVQSHVEHAPAAPIEPDSSREASPEVARTPVSRAKGDGEKKKRKIRMPADPNMPKRPLQPYLIFSNEQKRAIKDQRMLEGLAPLTMSQVNEQVQESWKALNTEDRSALESAYRENLKTYNELIQSYRASKLPNNVQSEDGTESTQEDASQDPGLSQHTASTGQPNSTPKKKSVSLDLDTAADLGLAPGEEVVKHKRSKKGEGKDSPERKKRSSKVRAETAI